MTELSAPTVPKVEEVTKSSSEKVEEAPEKVTPISAKKERRQSTMQKLFAVLQERATKVKKDAKATFDKAMEKTEEKPKPAEEAKKVEETPAEEAKKVEEKPAEEAKKVEETPAEEAKKVEETPAEEAKKVEETKPAEETKVEEEKPAAVDETKKAEEIKTVASEDAPKTADAKAASDAGKKGPSAMNKEKIGRRISMRVNDFFHKASEKTSAVKKELSSSDASAAPATPEKAVEAPAVAAATDDAKPVEKAAESAPEEAKPVEVEKAAAKTEEPAPEAEKSA